MAGIAGIVHWDGRPASRETVDRMLARIRHRGPDGLHADVRGNVGLGHARYALRAEEHRRAQPVWSRDGGCAIVADVRLYNRAELLADLGRFAESDESPTDAEILLAAYEQWDVAAIERVDGDLAFALWDGRRKRVLAARDPFGVKPLFYAAERDRIGFGSEPGALLAMPGFRCSVDESTVAQLLVTGRGMATEATFHEGIVRLLPGHVLVADAQGTRVQRWWKPAPLAAAMPVLPDPEYALRFYELFRNAVERRLAADTAVGIELSGGFDSSSVVAAAADLRARGSQRLPEVTTISQHYPGLPCDESTYIDAVVARSPFRTIHFDAPIGDCTGALEAELRKIDAPVPDIAWLRRAQGGALLAEAGCRVLLTGLGGDEIAWDGDYELDLWRDGQRARALGHCLVDPRVRRDGSQRESLMRLARAAVPQPIKRAIGRRLVRDARRMPRWITAHALAFDRGRAQVAPADAGWPSLAQAAQYGWLTSPGFAWLLEVEERLWAHRGLELRHPFLDRELAQFVLAIPWQARYRQPGPLKTLLVAGMGTRLPEVVRARRGKSVFDSYFGRVLAAGACSLEAELFGSGRWEAHRLVDRSSLEASWRAMQRTGAPAWNESHRLWLAGMVEVWMRMQIRDGAAVPDIADLPRSHTGLGPAIDARSPTPAPGALPRSGASVE